MRSQQFILLADEEPEEYSATRLGWFSTYEPEEYQEVRLVEQLILNDWLLKRANRKLLETEAVARDDHDHRIELMQRYKATTERAFYRSLSALEGLRKNILREKLLNMKLLQKQGDEIEDLKKQMALREPKPEALKSEGETRPSLAAQGKKKKRTVSLDQWVEIGAEEEGGRTVTSLYPSNERLIQNGKKLSPGPDLVYRRMHFVGRVPDEYAWTTGEGSIRESGGTGIQRMTMETWLAQIEKEKAAEGGHLRPCGGNLPRPAERGGCECDVCVTNRRILDARAGG